MDAKQPTGAIARRQLLALPALVPNSPEVVCPTDRHAALTIRRLRRGSAARALVVLQALLQTAVGYRDRLFETASPLFLRQHRTARSLALSYHLRGMFLHQAHGLALSSSALPATPSPRPSFNVREV